MTTVKHLYANTAKALNAETSWTVQGPGDTNPRVISGKISYMFEENARYWSFYFPEGATLAYVEHILRMPETIRCFIPEDPRISQMVGFADSPESRSLESMLFSGRVYLYIDSTLTDNERAYLAQLGIELSLSVMIRDKQYAARLTELSKPLAFISHDSRDKDELVRPLAQELSVRLRSVWYDEYSLKVGDSLRENIERGLREAKKCVLILSPSFIANEGWTRAEFDSIFAREIHEKNNVILPVWHNIDKAAVYEYCPRLVDRFALSSSLGVADLARKLVEVIDNP